MAWKKPTIYIANGRRSICSLCKCDLVWQEKEFEMLQIKGANTKIVREEILYCPSCKRFLITQAMSRELVRKYPGYYIDTSEYNLKSSKKSGKHIEPLITSNTIQKEEREAEVEAKAELPTTFMFPRQERGVSEHHSQTMHHVTNGMNSQVCLLNLYSYTNNICPACNSVMGIELVNIPVIDETGDFYRYYSDEVRFCYRCRNAFITKEIVESILNRIDSNTRGFHTIKVENATVHRDGYRYKYLFRPTLDNSNPIIHACQECKERSMPYSDSMELNPQSFLGKMGYSVNIGVSKRRYILKEAIGLYGKRKVSDHLAFLIATRKGQENGENRYANALRIWQEDINFITRQ